MLELLNKKATKCSQKWQPMFTRIKEEFDIESDLAIYNILIKDDKKRSEEEKEFL